MGLEIEGGLSQQQWGPEALRLGVCERPSPSSLRWMSVAAAFPG